MDILRQNLAPINNKAWEEINEQATDAFKAVLTGRKFVNVDGPKGWDFPAVPVGRIHVPEESNKGEVRYGINQVIPLIETRASFKLNIWELDNFIRGAEDIQFDNMEKAARKIAEFEEKAIYYGFEEANIKGLKESSEHEPIQYPDNISDVITAVAQGVSIFKREGVAGPYSLVVGIEKWQNIVSHVKGYPLQRQIEKVIGGSLILSPSIEEAFLVSEDEGAFKLTLGQDLSIGYEMHDSKEVQLYFTESFTFQVLDPAAVIVFR